MPRIPYQDPVPGTNPIADAMRARRGAEGLLPLDKILLNAPEIASGWNTLLGAIRTKNSLPGDVREIMILRVASRNSASFEWIHHDHVGLAEGLTPIQLTIARDLATPLPLPSSPLPLTPILAAALRFADASTFNVSVPKDVFEDLKQEFKALGGDREDQLLLEASAVVATYNMVSRLLVSLDVDDRKDQCVPLPESVQTSRDVDVGGGITIHVEMARRVENGDTAPWLVFVNSLMSNHKMWDAVLPRLSKKYNLLTYDQRGHGKSTVSPNPSTLPLLASDLHSIIHSLSLPLPLHGLIGVSQGACTSLQSSLLLPNLSTHYVICDTPPRSPPTSSQMWAERIASAREKGMSQVASDTLGRWFPNPGSEFREGGRKEYLIKEMIEATSMEGYVSGAEGLMSYDVQTGLVDSLKGKKVLLLVGELDGPLPGVMKSVAEELNEGGVDVEYVVIPGAGHVPMVDAPRVYLDHVEAFLEK